MNNNQDLIHYLQIGTTLYVAPEMNAGKPTATYNQKVLEKHLSMEWTLFFCLFFFTFVKVYKDCDFYGSQKNSKVSTQKFTVLWLQTQ
jgi:hypothetical protein